MSAGDAPGRLAVGIVADDLTGANDSAVQFARARWHASLGLVSQPSDAIDGGAVHALVSDSRAQNDETARRSTIAAVDTLRFARASRLFVKIDSTMRGSVQAQIDGALDSWSISHPGTFAVVCPAYPGMGRTVVDGRVLVNGAGVETTAIGIDPVTPVITSELSALLPGSVSVTIAGLDAAAARSRIEAAAASGARIIVADASSDADLSEIAAAVAASGPRAVPVGAAGLAVAMAAAWAGDALAGDRVDHRADTHAAGHAGQEQNQPASTVPHSEAPRRVLYVISSLHDVSRTQLQRLTAANDDTTRFTLAPSLAQVLDPNTIATWATERLAEAGELPNVIVVATPDARAEASVDLELRESASVTIATALAVVTETVFDSSAIDALVLVGGEGARAVLDRFEARAIRVDSAIREGIPLGTITGGKAHGLTVVTKAGGFGDADVLADLASELTTNTQGARP